MIATYLSAGDDDDRDCEICGMALAGFLYYPKTDICRDCWRDGQFNKTEVRRSIRTATASDKEMVKRMLSSKPNPEKKAPWVKLEDWMKENTNYCQKCDATISKKNYESRNRYKSRKFCSHICAKSYFRENKVGWFSHGVMTVEKEKRKEKISKLPTTIWTQEEIKNFTDNIPELAGF